MTFDLSDLKWVHRYLKMSEGGDDIGDIYAWILSETGGDDSFFVPILNT